jgi:hypothetical protein
VSNHLRHIRDKFGPDLPLDVLANSFGLLDLAPPDRGIDGGAPEFSRPRLKALVRRLKGTDARRS